MYTSFVKKFGILFKHKMHSNLNHKRIQKRYFFSFDKDVTVLIFFFEDNE